MHQVLIVPLWNWNLWHTETSYFYIRFNRTFMELKPKNFAYKFFANLTVLIVPLWNWNSDDVNLLE